MSERIGGHGLDDLVVRFVPDIQIRERIVHYACLGVRDLLVAGKE